jgi:hypothetical protein
MQLKYRCGPPRTEKKWREKKFPVSCEIPYVGYGKKGKEKIRQKKFKMKKDSRGGNSGQNKLGEVLTLPS